MRKLGCTALDSFSAQIATSDALGWMVCEISGEPTTVEAALTWLAGEGVQVDRLGDVVES